MKKIMTLLLAVLLILALGVSFAACSDDEEEIAESTPVTQGSDDGSETTTPSDDGSETTTPSDDGSETTTPSDDGSETTTPSNPIDIVPDTDGRFGDLDPLNN